jgi:hypothetical protein
MNPLLKNKIESAKNRSRHYDENRFFIPERFTFILHPIFQTSLWTAALVWGAFASLLSDNIMDFRLPSLHASLPANWYTVTFLLSGLILALGFAINQWVGRSQDSIVVDSIITMPPHDFWLYYGEEYTRTSALVENATLVLLGESKGSDEKAKYKKKFDEDVRRILNAVINLVKKWD